MIPGDIDLTKNLDFRRTRRKEIPQFPAGWKNGGGNIGINTIDTTLYHYDNYIFTITNTTSNRSTFTVTVYDDISDIDGMIYHWSSHDNYFTVSANSSLTTLTTTSDSINKYIVTKAEPERDIFGNIIELEKPLEQICWEKDELANNRKKKPIKQIPWIDDNHHNFNLTRDYDHDDRIPWDTEDNHHKKKESIADRICYLAGKSARFISDYFNEDEEDLSSYLTNMNWIRIRDAIIE